ncbi:hypothetical protein ACQ4PT_001338 [Festuca glaucescens]
MDGMGGAEQGSSPSSPSTHRKRPAGRTKFKETRHPVYRGVRRRGSAGRWVCEVRVPGKRGELLWLGTYVTAEAAARGHDAAMLALGGCSAACLNFADSARLLAVPAGLPTSRPSGTRRSPPSRTFSAGRPPIAPRTRSTPPARPRHRMRTTPARRRRRCLLHWMNCSSCRRRQCWAATCTTSSWTCPGRWTWARTTRTSRRGCYLTHRRRTNPPRRARMAELITPRSGATTETETPNPVLTQYLWNELNLLQVSKLKSEKLTKSYGHIRQTQFNATERKRNKVKETCVVLGSQTAKRKRNMSEKTLMLLSVGWVNGFIVQTDWEKTTSRKGY